MLANWMTTVPGVLTLVITLVQIWQTKTVDLPELQRALIGAGLIFAKDFNFTGGSRS